MRSAKIMPKLPTAKEISPTLGIDLDEQCALEHFCGLDRLSAIKMFCEYTNRLHIYMVDFVHMGDVGFSYYLPAFVNYLSELPDSRLAEEIPDSVDYILIRFSDSNNFPDVLKELIGLVHDRMQNMSRDLVPDLTTRLIKFITLYRKLE